MGIKKIFFKLRQLKSDVINRINFRYYGVRVGKLTGHIEGIITIRSARKESIIIGDRAELRSGKSYNIIGGDTRLILRTIGDGKITIGDHVGISNSALVSAASIKIEDDVMIGGSCKIWDTDFHSICFEDRNRTKDHDYQSKSICIKRGAFIGGGCIILKGVTIGEKSIVGAGSVVTKSIPSGEIWAGNPARFIKKLRNK